MLSSKPIISTDTLQVCSDSAIFTSLKVQRTFSSLFIRFWVKLCKKNGIISQWEHLSGPAGSWSTVTTTTHQPTQVGWSSSPRLQLNIDWAPDDYWELHSNNRVEVNGTQVCLDQYEWRQSLQERFESGCEEEQLRLIRGFDVTQYMLILLIVSMTSSLYRLWWASCFLC